MIWQVRWLTYQTNGMRQVDIPWCRRPDSVGITRLHKINIASSKQDGISTAFVSFWSQCCHDAVSENSRPDFGQAIIWKSHLICILEKMEMCVRIREFRRHLSILISIRCNAMQCMGEDFSGPFSVDMGNSFRAFQCLRMVA
jgi:hypothetical protein